MFNLSKYRTFHHANILGYMALNANVKDHAIIRPYIEDAVKDDWPREQILRSASKYLDSFKVKSSFTYLQSLAVKLVICQPLKNGCCCELGQHRNVVNISF